MSAFWLHHTDPLHQEYTPEGERRDATGERLEIDIFENLGSEIGPGKSSAHLTVHYTPDGHYTPVFPVDFSAHFHEFAVEWDPDTIGWFIDGEEVARYHGETPRGHMFILLALFHFSGWIGEVDPKMSYPKVFEVDYVRAYQRSRPRHSQA